MKVTMDKILGISMLDYEHVTEVQLEGKPVNYECSILKFNNIFNVNEIGTKEHRELKFRVQREDANDKLTTDVESFIIGCIPIGYDYNHNLLSEIVDFIFDNMDSDYNLFVCRIEYIEKSLEFLVQVICDNKEVIKNSYYINKDGD